MRILIALLCGAFSFSAEAATQNLVPPVPLTPVTVSISTSSTTAIANNPSRRGIVCVDTGSNNIYLAMGAYPAVVGSGIELNANGGSWTANDYTFTTAAINAIASGGTSTLSCQEYN